ncbi:MAG: sigma-70 family RNA polymerase sigma factor [Pirellulales bacterium]
MHIPGEHGGENQEAGAADEYSLVICAQRGDQAAFERLYRNHVGRVFALCLRMTADRELAEELTQSSFVRIWEQLGKFKRKSSFGTWSHRVALNVVLEYMRSRARRPKHTASRGDAAIQVAKSDSPGARMDLEWAIRALPERARQVFVLYEIERLQHNEIAEMLGIAVGTSKAQLHRARQLLRELLE